MADDENKEEDFLWTPPDAGPASAPETRVAKMRVVTQFVKDLSFENPGAGVAFERPQISLSADIQVRSAAEVGNFEVVLKLRITAAEEQRTMFLLELAYGGIFYLENVPEDSVEPVLLIDCPQLLFPYARRIVSDVVRDGGFPALLIDPIDFPTLYKRRKAENGGQSQPGS